MAGLALALALPAGQALAQQGKELVVATDTAFVPFEFKQTVNTPVLTSTCGMRSPRRPI